MLAVLDAWWGGLKGGAGSAERALLLPRLHFQHFTTTSLLVEHDSGEIAAFPVGFLSQTAPEAAYVHFAGIDPTLHGQGDFGWRKRGTIDIKISCPPSPLPTSSGEAEVPLSPGALPGQPTSYRGESHTSAKGWGV
ncbi:hypothetical protein ACFW2T_15890 [Streptomyces sp. NPDC058892]|uniref:hypothetical protein n=1 Tax=unclassified Streptomyces TaxID=2593676 RepID=UPI0036848FDE